MNLTIWKKNSDTPASPTTALDVQKKVKNSLFQQANISSCEIIGLNLSMRENVSAIVAVMVTILLLSMFPFLAYRDE